MFLRGLLILIATQGATLMALDERQVQHDYIVARWCQPFTNLTPTADPSYDLAVKSFFTTNCSDLVHRVQSLVTFFGLNNVFMPFTVNSHLSRLSMMTMIKQNFTVSREFLNAHCRARIVSRFYFGVWQFLSAILSPSVIGQAIFFLQGFVNILFSPFVLVSTILNAKVLREVGREQSIYIMPLFHAELALNVLGHVTFAYFIELMVWLPVAPFCFVSPLVALNFEIVGIVFSLWAMNPIWLLSSLVKSITIAERVIALYAPFWYHSVVTVNIVNRTFAYAMLVALLSIGVFTAFMLLELFSGNTTFVNFSRQTNALFREVTVKVSLFYCSLMVVFAIVQVLGALLLVYKLRRNIVQVHGEALSTATRNIRKKEATDVTIMVVSTSGLNVLTCCMQIVYIVAHECATGCAAVLPKGIRTDVIVLITGIIVDLNSGTCFALQCIFSKAFRAAARKLFITPMTSRLRQFCKSIRSYWAPRHSRDEFDELRVQPSGVENVELACSYSSSKKTTDEWLSRHSSLRNRRASI